MRPQDIVEISLGTVSEKKLRFALNLVGILVGCAAVGGLVSITTGMRNDISADIMGFGPNVINVYPVSDGSVNTIQLGWRELRIIEAIPGVKAATPMNFGGTCAYKARGNHYYTGVIGVSEKYFQISGNWELLEGRYLTRNDKAAAVVTEWFVKPPGFDEPLYGIGDRVKIVYRKDGAEYEYTFRIVGIMTEQSSGFGSQATSTMYVSLSAFEQMFETDGGIHLIKLNTVEMGQVREVANRIVDKLGYVGVYTMDMLMDNINNVLNTLNAVLGGIAGLSLVVAGVGIINTMTVSVMERTKEIGTMKAIGARSTDVMGMFLTEAVITGVIGGVIGALFGFLLTYLISRFTEIPSASSPSLGFLIVGFAMVTCVISGLHPAWRASKMNPVEALRHE
ncbi:MAG: ABC transporter permease [Candidatus Bathyarchaeota archaeon]|nr:ABC transporter permease [Candidatus Bathyarchaeota archaeon]